MASADLVIRANDTTPALAQTITDAAGTVLNLTGATVRFIMRSPTAATAQVNAAATVVSAVAGTVSYAWAAADTAVPGLYQGVFRVTLSGGGTYTFPNDGYLDIWIEEDLTSDAGQLLVSLSDVKDYLRIEGTSRKFDQELVRFIRGMQPVVESLTGPIVPTKYDEWYKGGSSSIRLRHRPVITLLAVSEYRGPAEFVLSLIATPVQGQIYSAMLDQTGFLVRRAPGGSIMAFPAGEQAVHVVYTAGRSTVPENVRLGTLELIRVNFQHTELGGASASAGLGNDELLGQHIMGYLVPQRVREMLAPNRRAPSIA